MFVNWILLPLMGGNRRLADASRMKDWYTTHETVAAKPGRALRQEFTIERTETLSMPGWRQAGAMRLLSLHGGAHVHELIGPHRDIVAGLARRTRATVDIPRYPLAPKHTWADAAGPLLGLTKRLLAETPKGYHACWC